MSSIDPSSKLSGVTPPPLQLNTTGGEGSGGASTTYGDVIMGGPQMDYFLNTQEASISASLDQFNQNLAITEEFQSDVQAMLSAVNELPLLTPDEISSMTQQQAEQLAQQANKAKNDFKTAAENLKDFCNEPSTQAYLSENPDFAAQLKTFETSDGPGLYLYMVDEYNALCDMAIGTLYPGYLDDYTGAPDTSSLNSLMESLTTISSSETTQFSVLTKEQLSLVKSMQNLLTTISQTASQIVNQIAPT